MVFDETVDADKEIPIRNLPHYVPLGSFFHYGLYSEQEVFTPVLPRLPYRNPNGYPITVLDHYLSGEGQAGLHPAEITIQHA